MNWNKKVKCDCLLEQKQLFWDQEIAYHNGDRGFFCTVINAYNNQELDQRIGGIALFKR